MRCTERAADRSQPRSRPHRWITRLFLVVFGLLSHGGSTLWAADTADETRAMGREVLALIRAHKLAEADALARKGLALCDDTGSVKVFCAAQFQESLGDIAFDQRRYAEALAAYQQSLEVRSAGLDPSHMLIARSQMRLGRNYAVMGREAEAEASLLSAVAILEKLSPPDAQLGTALSYLSGVYYRTKRLNDAIAAARRAIQSHVAAGANPRDLLTEKLNLMAFDVEAENLDEAIVLAQAAYPDASKLSLGDSLRHSWANKMVNLANHLSGLKRYADAEPIAREAAQLLDPPWSGTEGTAESALGFLGAILVSEGRYAEAEAPSLKALDLSSKFLPGRDPSLPSLLANIATLYNSQEKSASAIEYGTRALAALTDTRQLGSLAHGLVLLTLGDAHRKLRGYGAADTELAASWQILDKALVEGDPRRAHALVALGRLRYVEEKLAEAVEPFDAALALQQKYGYFGRGWRSSILAELAMADRDLGHYGEAESALSEAIQIEEAAGASRQTVLATRLDQLATVFRREDCYVEAERLLSRALAIKQPEADRAMALNSLGLIYLLMRQYEKAESPLWEALAIRSKLPPDDSLVLETMDNLATLDLSLGRRDEAQLKFREALAIAETRGPPRSIDIALQSRLLAEALIAGKKVDEAEPLMLRAFELYELRLGPDNPRTLAALKGLAALELTRGRVPAAERRYRQVLAVDERRLGADAPAVAVERLDLAAVLRILGKWREALAGTDAAIETLAARYGEESPRLATAISSAANLAFETSRYAEAHRLAERLQRIQERDLGEADARLAVVLTLLARIEIATGRLDEAETKLAHADELLANGPSAQHALALVVLVGRADLASAKGDHAMQETHDRRALALARELIGEDAPATADAADRLAAALWAQAKHTEAVQLRRDLLARAEREPVADHAGVARAARGLADALAVSAQAEEAELLYGRAIAIDERLFGRDSDQAALDHLGLGALQGTQGRFEEARAETERARSTWKALGNLTGVSAALAQLGNLSVEEGSPAEAIIHAEMAVTNAELAYGLDGPALTPALTQLALDYLEAGRVEDGKAVVSRIESLLGDALPEQSPFFLDLLLVRASRCLAVEDFDGAEALLNRSVAYETRYIGPGSRAVGFGEYSLALAYLSAKRFDDAIASFNRALAVFRQEDGARSPLVGQTLFGLAKAYAGKGETDVSAQLFETARSILGNIPLTQRLIVRAL